MQKVPSYNWWSYCWNKSTFSDKTFQVNHQIKLFQVTPTAWTFFGETICNRQLPCLALHHRLSSEQKNQHLQTDIYGKLLELLPTVKPPPKLQREKSSPLLQIHFSCLGLPWSRAVESQSPGSKQSSLLHQTPPPSCLSSISRVKMRVKREFSRATDWQLTSAAAACWESSSLHKADCTRRQAQDSREPHRTQQSEEIGHCCTKDNTASQQIAYEARQTEGTGWDLTQGGTPQKAA